MSISSITSKWQTTIPKDIRNFMGLKPNDKILYIVDGEKVILKPLKGNILDLRGSVTPKKKPVDFKKVRTTVKKKVAKKIIEDSK